MATGRSGPRDPMAWQSTLGEMKRHGTRLKLTCLRCPDFWPVDFEAMLAERGPDFMVWDASEPCPNPGCTSKLFYLGSLGESTPFRPLKTI